MYKVCPECGIPAIGVNKEAVYFNLNRKLENSDEMDKWSVCINPTCEVVYFSKNKRRFFTKELKYPVFFKDNSGNVPICYCSGLLRGEIQYAVKNGCKTIDEVQEFTGKNITGNCKERNPLGQCCRNSFLFEINQASENTQNDFDNKTCNCCK